MRALVVPAFVLVFVVPAACRTADSIAPRCVVDNVKRLRLREVKPETSTHILLSGPLVSLRIEPILEDDVAGLESEAEGLTVRSLVADGEWVWTLHAERIR
jgi:hypothetical protein